MIALYTLSLNQELIYHYPRIQENPAGDKNKFLFQVRVRELNRESAAVHG